MKKKIYFLGTLVVLSTPIATIISCGDNKDSQKFKIASKFDDALSFSGNKSKKKIGTLLSDPENPRWQKALKFANSYGKKMFKESFSQILKQDKEQKDWFNANQLKLDALIVGATADSFNPWKSSAWTSSKPVIAFDRLIKTSSRTAYNWYVAYDNAIVGKLQGLWILNKIYDKNWNSKTTDKEITDYVTENKLDKRNIVLSVAGDPADNNSQYFFNGAMDIFKKVAKVDTNFIVPDGTKLSHLNNFTDFTKVAQPKWDYAKGQTFLQGDIAKMTDDEKEDFVAILSPNDGMAIAAINALKQNGIDPKKVYITGQDSNDSAILSIADKKLPGQNMTISKPDRDSLAVAMALAKELLADPGYNVGVTALNKKDKNATALIKKIKAIFPDIEITYDSKTYKTGDKEYINTLLLKPRVVTKDNIGSNKLFEISE